MSTALSTCILKDGTQTVTADIPMSGHKFTGMTAGTALDDSAMVHQIQTNGAAFAATDVTGTGDNILLTLSPAALVYTNGMEVTFKARAPNTTTPSVTVNSIAGGAKLVNWPNGGNLLAADIVADAMVTLRYVAAVSRFHLMTVVTPVTAAVVAANSAFKSTRRDQRH